MKKTMTKLCSEIAKREAGKSEVAIGNIREVMRCFADLCVEDSKEWLDVFAAYAARRGNRRAK
jgi:hypothetical protein